MKRDLHIAGIDGLRALAVLAVMLFHLKPGLLPGGFSGVDVFFVISGYVVSHSVGSYLSQNIGQFYVTFLTRRVRRIIPALLTCLLVTALLCVLLVPPGAWLSVTMGQTALGACFGLSNFALVWLNDGYFSPRAEFNPFTHTWSLAVEEQFYLLFPLLFLPWLRRGASVWRTRLLGATAVLSLAWAAYATPRYPQVSYYLLPSRFWELAAGVFLQHAHATGRLTGDAMSKATSGVLSRVTSEVWLNTGLLLVTLGFVLCDAQAFPFPWALLSVIGTLAALHGLRFSPIGHLSSRALEHPVVSWIGRLSYSLYLWHWPVYVLFRWTVGIEGPISALVAIAVTFGFAACSYYFVEQPIRTSRTRGVRAIAWGLTASALAAAAIHVGFRNQGSLSLSVASNERVWSPYYLAALASDNGESRPKSRRLFVIGDSHAAAYTLLARETARLLDAEYEVHSKLGCPVAKIIPTQAPPHCGQTLVSRVSEVTERAKPGDVVFFASLRLPRLATQWEVIPEDEIERTHQDAMSLESLTLGEREAEAFVRPLVERGVFVVIDAPKPIFKAPPFRCSDWFNRSNPICAGGFEVERSFMEDYRRPVVQALARIAQKHPNVRLWDPLPDLCGPTRCTALKQDGSPLFSDGDHLTAVGNEHLVPSFLKVMQPLWGSPKTASPTQAPPAVHAKVH
jgi:peptidoglycan/LPS O-acetylase OafA/YrhL